MPTGLYGSPQLGPYREVRRRQSAARRLAGIVTLEPIWKRVIPWSSLRVLFSVVSAFALITPAVVAGTFAIRSGSSADLATRAQSFLHLDATPTLTVQQLAYVVDVARQRNLAAVPPATVTPVVRAGGAALLLSTCTSTGLPAITTCHGSLRNVSGRRLNGLQVSLRWSATQGGDPQLTASASIDLDPLLSDQTSTWTVVNRYNDVLRWYSARVTDVSGQELRVSDERPVTP